MAQSSLADSGLAGLAGFRDMAILGACEQARSAPNKFPQRHGLIAATNCTGEGYAVLRLRHHSGRMMFYLSCPKG